MIGNKVEYTCKNCGWMTQIRQEWADLKPKRCMNKKCNTSFLKYPEALLIKAPEDPKEETKSEPEKPQSRRSRKSEPKDVKPE